MRDLLLVGRVHTLDPSRPRAEAVLVRAGRIARVASAAECAALAAPDAARLEVGSVVPGLADAHGHVQWLGRGRTEVSCAEAASEEDCAALLAERARTTPPGRWVRGRGWDQHRWPGARFPGEATLTRAVPDHPAIVTRVDGHASWVNARALAAAGIGPDTPDPPGGRILRGSGGAPTGVLVDAAQALVLGRLPAPSAAELEAELLAGLEALAALGLTAVHDAGVGPATLDVYRRLAEEDRLPLRVYAMIDGEGELAPLADELRRRRAEGDLGRLSVRAVKLFADGALGSRGAALHEDYADEPGNRGLLLAEPAVLAAKVRAAAEAGFQPAIHAIGDRAVSVTLAALEAAGDLRALRPRVEHLQLVRQGDLARLAAAGAVASMQPVHAASDAPWIAARVGGDRLRCAYAWRSVLRAGLPLAFGSDVPVEPADPRLGLAAAEERAGPGGVAFVPEERLRREEALRAFTWGAAFASFAEARRGAIREGLDADLTAFDGDVLEAPVEALRTMPVACTVVGGRIEWAAGGAGDVRSNRA